MYTSVKKLLDEGLMSKWVKVTDEEAEAIVDSIAGENMVRNAKYNKMDGVTHGDNLRHHIDRGYICITSTFSAEAEKHPLDAEKKPAETRVHTGDSQGVPAVKGEEGVFASQ